MKQTPLTAKEKIKAICEAFASGNIAFILENFSEKFTWHDPCDPFIVPYGGIFKGKKGVSEFFHLLNTNTDMNLFEVHEYIAEDDKVVATGKYEFRSTRTGEHAISEWIVIFHFENDEPLSARMYYNTSDVEKAFS
jgi:ketosteroid isomerase-like protein